jgi:hypothetical protein
MVEFYDAFHKTALIYLLPVTPFDCISIKMGFEALCPPGLGIPRYAQISRVLMEVLPRLLPRSDTQISTLINMVRMESGNGFDLLWRVMALSVPGFDPTRQVTIPMWDDADIFDFALSFLLYFRLLAKKGVVQDDRTNSISFLNAITEPAYADTITTLMTCITNYASGLDDGYLPQTYVLWVWRLNCIRMREPVPRQWFLGCDVRWECTWMKGNAVAAFRVL